jgi:hypothetical protein
VKREKMFDYCTRSICCTTGFLKEMLKAAQISGKKCNFRMNGIEFLIFPNGIIDNALGEHVKIVNPDGTVENIEH